MTRTPAGRWLATTITMLALAGNASAGQVFVDVGTTPNRFTPANAGVFAPGDFVIWTWGANLHTVTSGPSPPTPNGIFDSDPGGGSHNAGTVFAWKTDRTATVPYFCRVHWFLPMTGTINVAGDQAPPMADLRIAEVRFDGVDNFIKVGNYGAGAGNLRGFRLSINGASPATPVEWSASTPVSAGGTGPAAHPTGLTNSGSATLYAPYLAGSVPGTALATDTTFVVDYVEWGTAGGQPLEDVVVQISAPDPIWFPGQFAPQAGPGHSIVRCLAPPNVGNSVWNESVNPMPGAGNDCVNPTRTTTWGRLKTLYR